MILQVMSLRRIPTILPSRNLSREPFEVVLIFGGDVGRDGGIDLLLRQGGRGAQEQRGQGTARRAHEREARAAPGVLGRR